MLIRKKKKRILIEFQSQLNKHNSQKKKKKERANIALLSLFNRCDEHPQIHINIILITHETFLFL